MLGECGMLLLAFLGSAIALFLICIATMENYVMSEQNIRNEHKKENQKKLTLQVLCKFQELHLL